MLKSLNLGWFQTWWIGVLISGINPYSNYSVYVEVCTRVGCSRSEEVQFQTKDAAPEGEKNT